MTENTSPDGQRIILLLALTRTADIRGTTGDRATTSTK